MSVQYKTSYREYRRVHRERYDRAGEEAVNVPLLPCPDEITLEHLRAENDDITQADGDRNGREESDCGESVLAEHPADKQVVDDTAGAESDQHQNVAERYPQERST